VSNPASNRATNQTASVETPARASAESHWRVIDRTLRDIAGRRAALDAEEARWLREAEQLRIWKCLGMADVFDYMNRALHYQGRTAQDRLRVARALGHLPTLEAALARGEVSFSTLREITRVATPDTEAAWLKASIGLTARDVEDLVALHGKGDRPTDDPKPQVRPHVVRFELPPEVYTLFRQVKQLVNEAAHRHMDEAEVFAAMCHTVLDNGDRAETSGRAKYVIALKLCPVCKKGTQVGGGTEAPVGAAAVEQAMCDAMHVGSLDGDMPERAAQDIPPSVARMVWLRDGGRCQTPGCRSAIGVQIHHITPRAESGSHVPANLTCRCFRVTPASTTACCS
jgi:uncharacterized protein DUF222